MPVSSIMELVPYNFKEQSRGFRMWIIVNGGSIEVEHLPIKHLLGRADVTNAVKKFLPVAATAEIL